MKKILFATTALIATASMAAAEVRISGYGRFGLDYNEANGAVPGVSETNLTTRLRIQFDMSAETDGGVTFGARLRLQTEQRDGVVNGGGLGGNTAANGARFFARTGGLTVQVGNIAGAIESMPGLYLETRTAGVGIDGAGFSSLVLNTANSAFAWDAYSSGGTGASNGIEVMYSAGAFGAHLSYSNPNGANNNRTGVNLSYKFGDWQAAIGYQDTQNNIDEKLIVTLQGDLGFAGVRVAYGQNKNPGAIANQDVDKLGIYGTFELGAATNLVAFVTNEDNPNVPAADGIGYGLHLSHDLGGGASFEAGWVETSTDNTTVQAGVYFSF